MSDRSLSDIHPDLRPICQQWLDKCRLQSINSFVDFTWRSSAEQDALYAQGRTAPGRIVTNARGGQSKHNFTLDGKPASKAFDFAIQDANGLLNWNIKSIEFQTAVTIGKQIGLKWGGDWPGKLGDYVHFEID